VTTLPLTTRPLAHPQLESVAEELDDATGTAQVLAGRATEEAFQRRPAPTRWSAAECFHHLNITSRAFLPLIDKAMKEAAASRSRTPTYKRDFVGWLLCRMLEPPYSQRLKTTPPFVPLNAGSKDDLLREFTQLQQELIARLSTACGLDLVRVRIRSPFNERMRYNVYSCFRILAAHQRRHLWQAAGVLDAHSFSAS
jgi:hypothetical protein